MGNKYSSLLLLASLLTPMSLQQNVNQTAIRSQPLPQQPRIVPNVKEINTRSRSYGNPGGYRTGIPPFRINVFQSDYGSNGGGSGYSEGYGRGGYLGSRGGYGGGGYAGNGDRYRGGGYGGNFGGIVAGYGRKDSNANGYGGNIRYDGGYVGSLGYNSGVHGRGNGGGIYGSTHYGGNGNNDYFGGNSGGYNGNSLGHFGDGYGGNTVYGKIKHRPSGPVIYCMPTEEVCKAIPEKDKIDCSQGESNWTIPGCLAIGCCHIKVPGSPSCFYPFPNISKHQAKCQVPSEAKKDCGNTTTEMGCLVKDCCWDKVAGSPSCYFVDVSKVEFKKAGTVTSGTGPLQKLFSHINVTDS